jgi:adenylyltransferase/sulfurtransferase
MKILVGAEEINRDLIIIDVWRGEFSHFQIGRRTDCPACRGEYQFLEARFGTRTTSLCGQNAVQVLNPEAGEVSLKTLATHLEPLGKVSYSEFMLRFRIDGYEMVIFPDGRAIVKNTDDESLARGLYAKYIGM